MADGEKRRRSIGHHAGKAFIDSGLAERRADELVDERNVFLAVVSAIEMIPGLIGVHHRDFDHGASRGMKDRSCWIKHWRFGEGQERAEISGAQGAAGGPERGRKSKFVSRRRARYFRCAALLVKGGNTRPTLCAKKALRTSKRAEKWGTNAAPGLEPWCPREDLGREE